MKSEVFRCFLEIWEGKVGKGWTNMLTDINTKGTIRKELEFFNSYGGNNMAEMRLYIPDEVVEHFQKILGPYARPTDIVKDAITFYNWAVNERAKGNIILSSDQNFEHMTRIALPSLERVRPHNSRF